MVFSIAIYPKSLFLYEPSRSSNFWPSDVEDANEMRSLPTSPVKTLVESVDEPLEHSLIAGLERKTFSYYFFPKIEYWSSFFENKSKIENANKYRIRTNRFFEQSIEMRIDFTRSMGKRNSPLLTLEMASTANSACSLFWAFWTCSLPTLMRGRRKAFPSSETGSPSRWHTFWITKSSLQFDKPSEITHLLEDRSTLCWC